MFSNKTIQAWKSLDKTEEVNFSKKVWLESINKLKPQEVLRAKWDQKGELIPIRLRRLSFFRRVWATIKSDPWFNEHRICLRNTELCVSFLMKELENQTDNESIHTSLHLLRSLSQDKELSRRIGKKKLQLFQSKLLHEILERLTPHIDFQGEKELLEKQALFALVSSNPGLFKKMKKDKRFPIIRSEMLTIDHIKSQREWHKRRIKKLESFIRHLSELANNSEDYKEAFKSLVSSVEKSHVLSQEEILQLKGCLEEYEGIERELFALSGLYEEILTPSLSQVSPRELDHLVSRFGLSFEKAAAPVFLHLKQIPILEKNLFELLKKIQKEPSLVQEWWNSLDEEFKRFATPWHTKETPICTHLTKQFRPCDPILKYLDQYLNELIGLKLIMQKGCLAEKSLSQCAKTLFQLNRTKNCVKPFGLLVPFK
jgi:hypothetical protein